MKCTLGDKPTIKHLVHMFSLPEENIQKVLTFLLVKGLIVEKNGVYDVGVSRTYLGKNSPNAAKHHSNWRIQCAQRAAHLQDTDLMFTAPLSCSYTDQQLFREKIRLFIKKFLAWHIRSQNDKRNPLPGVVLSMYVPNLLKTPSLSFQLLLME